MTAGGGVALPVLARRTAAAGLTGFEWAVGVPGSVGGAVRMNAGGHGSDMAAVPRRRRRVRPRRTGAGAETLRRSSALGLRFRGSDLADDRGRACAAALAARAAATATTAEAEIAEIVRWRREHQPGGQNAGSVFVNPVPGEVTRRRPDRRARAARPADRHAPGCRRSTPTSSRPTDGGSAADVRAVIEAVRDRVADADRVRAAQRGPPGRVRRRRVRRDRHERAREPAPTVTPTELPGTTCRRRRSLDELLAAFSADDRPPTLRRSTSTARGRRAARALADRRDADAADRRIAPTSEIDRQRRRGAERRRARRDRARRVERRPEPTAAESTSRRRRADRAPRAGGTSTSTTAAPSTAPTATPTSRRDHRRRDDDPHRRGRRPARRACTSTPATGDAVDAVHVERRPRRPSARPADGVHRRRRRSAPTTSASTAADCGDADRAAPARAAHRRRARAEAGARLQWVARRRSSCSLVVVAALAVLGSSLFAIEPTVDVERRRLHRSRPRSHAVVDDLDGTPVLRVDTHAAERELEAIPWVEDGPRARPTSRTAARIEIRERVPVATYQGPTASSGCIDGDGPGARRARRPADRRTC